MNKKDLSEADTKAKFITPSVLNAGWDELTQLGREIYFTDKYVFKSPPLRKQIRCGTFSIKQILTLIILTFGFLSCKNNRAIRKL